jgi:hypothetical protein
MPLLVEMKAELGKIWKRTVYADNWREREQYLSEYREKYRRYKKQIEFSKAIDEKPFSEILKEQTEQSH